MDIYANLGPIGPLRMQCRGSLLAGMNFQYMPEFGKKSVELLEDDTDFMAHNGYFMFWLLVIVTTGLLACSMKCTGYL